MLFALLTPSRAYSSYHQALSLHAATLNVTAIAGELEEYWGRRPSILNPM